MASLGNMQPLDEQDMRRLRQQWAEADKAAQTPMPGFEACLAQAEGIIAAAQRKEGISGIQPR